MDDAYHARKKAIIERKMKENQIRDSIAVVSISAFVALLAGYAEVQHTLLAVLLSGLSVFAVVALFLFAFRRTMYVHVAYQDDQLGHWE